jgi:hypothetical protein
MQRMGVFSQNDIRELEELNPIEGEDAEAADRYYQQSQMIPLADSAEPKPEPPPMPPPGFGPEPPNGDGEEEPEEDEEAEARIRPLVLDAAQRCVRRESNALRGPTAKYENDEGGFWRWANGFYHNHREYVRNAFAPLVHSFDADEARFSVFMQGWHKQSLERIRFLRSSYQLHDFESYEPEAAEQLTAEFMMILEVK